MTGRPQWRIAALASKLADGRSRLDELQAGDLAVRASFSAGYASVRSAAAHVGAPPDRAFRLLGLAGGADISLPTAAALLDVPLTRAEQARELLVAHNLLQSAEPGAVGDGHLPLTFAGYADALAWLDAEYANLVSAVRQAAAQREHELAWQTGDRLALPRT
ncbi:MAG: hypothetical protein ACRDOD_17080, partial [Streptosporangiaceae bacterium]